MKCPNTLHYHVHPSPSSLHENVVRVAAAAFFAGGFFGGGCAFVFPDPLHASVVVFALL